MIYDTGIWIHSLDVCGSGYWSRLDAELRCWLCLAFSWIAFKSGWSVDIWKLLPWSRYNCSELDIFHTELHKTILFHPAWPLVTKKKSVIDAEARKPDLISFLQSLIIIPRLLFPVSAHANSLVGASNKQKLLLNSKGFISLWTVQQISTSKTIPSHW